MTIGSLWILFSDKAASLLSVDKESLIMISTYKGWFYVSVTAFILYYLLQKLLNKIESAEQEIIENNQKLIAAHQEVEATNEEIHQQYDELKSYNDQLRINQDRLRRAQALARVGNWELDLESKKIWASEEAFRIYGIYPYTTTLPLEKAQRLAHTDDRPLLDSALQDLIDGKGSYDQIYRIHRESDGVERTLHSAAILEKDSGGRPHKVLGVIQDITEQYLAEKQMRYYAEHDVVTGLYNRRFFEQEIQEIHNKAKKITIIMCDVDGLKLINDAMGHEEGDDFLRSCAKIFIQSCPENSVIARIGGDEFAIILKDVEEHESVKVQNLIRNKVEEYNTQSLPIPLSISIGITHCLTNYPSTISQAIREAEEKMYFNKLLHSQSMRSGTVDILMKTLEARDYITEGHTDRLQVIVEKLASKIGLGELEKSKLSLFARFHDIGKVGIPDSILFKPGKLNLEEFEEMKKHSEIGFRIANSSLDLAHISDFILKHHEWWDGQGYPLGISGEDIPLECRILAIADAYDSMANDRPYRKAMGYNERIEELLKYSGTQFDPHLVSVFIGLLEEINITRTG